MAAEDFAEEGGEGFDFATLYDVVEFEPCEDMCDFWGIFFDETGDA